LVPSKKQDKFIYSWVDKDGVKKFSNIRPSETKRDLVVTKAITSKQSKKLNRKSYISSTSRAKETSVLIKNNQILVPVKLGNNGKEISTLLLLDTGATTTTIHDDFADKLGYFDYKYSKSQIADGRIVDTKLSNFDYIIIGPYRMNNFRVIVMNYQGNSSHSKGLLGMNFLKNVKYQIDYQRKIIKWL
jgi:predicted aspartyl protease